MRVLAKLLGVVALCVVSAASARADNPAVMHLAHIDLSSTVGTSGHDNTVWVALHFSIAPGWHTYWRNPGQSGLPMQVAWKLPNGVQAGSVAWPTPTRFNISGIVNYGYADDVVFLVPLRASRLNALAGTATAHVSWLLCAEECIPQTAELPIDLGRRRQGDPVITDALKHLPVPFAGDASVHVSQGSLDLSLSGAQIHRAESVAFFPATRRAIDYSAAPDVRFGKRRLELRFATARHFQKFTTLTGVLVLGNRAFDIDGKPVAVAGPANEDHPSGLLSFALAVAFAFAGGLVLNLMPCVFPILSMKALALAQSGERADELHRDGILYFSGVMISFLGVAGVLIALRAAGHEVGWGFQLQAPQFVLLMFLLTGGIGLNLLGAFELPSGLSGVGQGLVQGTGAMSSFFTGVLAVLVASPCTAPFMGSALGFAITQPAIVALSVFAALGAGFGLPFALLTFLPRLVRRVPRPGAWMVIFKEFLAFPMLGTAIWLLWVLGREAGATGMTIALLIALGAAFSYWMLLALPVRLRWPVAALATGALIFAGMQLPVPNDSTRHASAWEPWSPQAVAKARASGHPVLVDFTAAWCLTCLVNERVALDTGLVADALASGGILTLKGDWTSRDPQIGAELARHGRAGVPLYLLYPAQRSGNAVVLPQILTPSIVLDAIKSVRSRH